MKYDLAWFTKVLIHIPVKLERAPGAKIKCIMIYIYQCAGNFCKDSVNGV